jgi:hypothetical protein
MGIYGNGKIYGIFIRVWNQEGCNTEVVDLFKYTSDQELSAEEKREAFAFYENLANKDNISFQLETECYSSLEREPSSEVFRMWVPISLESFLQQFDV